MTLNDNKPAAAISMTINDKVFSTISHSKAAKIGTFGIFSSVYASLARPGRAPAPARPAVPLHL